MSRDINSEYSFDIGIANKTVRTTIIVYALTKILFFILFVDAEWWLSRIAISLSMITVFFVITSIKRLTKRQLAVLVPYSMVLLEIINAVFFGGDRVIYVFLMGIMIVSIMYIDQVGLLIMCILTTLTICLCIFVFDARLLGEQATLTDEIFNFFGILMLYLFGYFFSKYILSFLIKLQTLGQAFNAVLETTPNLMCIVNGNKKIEYISESFVKFMGKEKNKIQVEDIFHSDDLTAVFNDAMTQDYLTEKTVSFDKDGEQRWFALHTALMGKKKGTRFFEFAEITPIIEAQKAAEHANKAKTQFLATMSHEIRTPMNAIIGISQIQIQKGNLPHDSEIALGKIYNSGNNLLRIINDILDMSKIETGKMEISPVEYDVPSFIHDTVQLNIIRIENKPIKFILTIDENLPSRLIGDEIRLKQILNNLLSNSIKYTKEGHVELSVSHTAEDGDITLRFAVKDTGQGLKPEDLAQLFSEYQRFNIEANRATEGTGIGLRITKNLAEMMGGNVEVESEYGKGSTFKVTVRQKAVECAPIGAELAAQLSNFTFKEQSQHSELHTLREIMPYGKVLLVDDVETNLYVAEGLLSPYQLKIETAVSGFEALDLINGGNIYDIVFMDHMMPLMDGIETTHKLRELGYKGIIVALTANALAGNDKMFSEHGFDGFISKPIDIWQLNAVLTRFIHDKYPEEAKKYKKVSTDEKKPLSNINPKLAQIFKRDAQKAVVALRETLSSGDIKMFTTTAHAMKSALANIGEEALSAKAFALEEAAQRGDNDFIRSNTENLIKGLEALIENLVTAEPDQNEDGDIQEDLTYLHEQLLIIKTACEDYDDMAAYKALARLQLKTYKKETSAALEDMKNLLYLHSNFEEAAEQATLMLDKLKTVK